MKLKFVGRQYSGFDPEKNESVRALTNDVVDVSEAKAKQLLSDFPNEWEAVGEPKEKTKVLKPAPKGSYKTKSK